MLPGPSVETSRGGGPRKLSSRRAPPGIVTGLKPANEEFSISIQRLGIRDILLGDSPAQGHLDREGIMHLTDTGFPYQRGSNTYIVGHAGDFDANRIPNPFKTSRTFVREILSPSATPRVVATTTASTTASSSTLQTYGLPNP